MHSHSLGWFEKRDKPVTDVIGMDHEVGRGSANSNIDKNVDLHTGKEWGAKKGDEHTMFYVGNSGQ